MLLVELGRLGAHGVDQLIGLAPRAGFALRQGLAEVEGEQGGAHAGERDLLDRVVVALADAKVGIAVAAAIGGVIEQGGRLAFADHIDAGAVRGQPARAEIAVVIGAQLAAVGAAPVDRHRRIEHEVGVREGFGAGGEADRARGAAFGGAQLAGIGVARGRLLLADGAQLVARLVLLVVRPLARWDQRRIPPPVLADRIAQLQQYPADTHWRLFVGQGGELAAKRWLEVGQVADDVCHACHRSFGQLAGGRSDNVVRGLLVLPSKGAQHAAPAARHLGVI